MGNRLLGSTAPVRLLFLDVDGVLNSSESRARNYDARASQGGEPAGLDGIDAPDGAMCDFLADIVRRTGARVVLSSTWRLEPHKFTF